MEVAASELVVLVDEENTPLGTMLKSEVHSAQTPLHRAFSLFLFNARGEFLLQRRSAQKKAWPRTWSNSCCGHPGPGEENETAIRRRLRDELGVVDHTEIRHVSDYRYRFTKDGIEENEICPVFLGRTDATVNPNAAEIDGVKWMSWKDFTDDVKENPAVYSPWCIEETLLVDAKLDELASSFNPPLEIPR